MASGKRKLLVHVCCAPDFTTCRQWFGEAFEIAGFFYNPNIYPQEEYALRLSEARKVAAAIAVRLLEGEFEPREWESEVAGLGQEPEGGRRCEKCFTIRLRETARRAAIEGRFDAFTTTLTISPHKSEKLINSIGKEAGRLFGVEFIEENLKRGDGFKASVQISRALGLYRQTYCGCRYSLDKPGHS